MSIDQARILIVDDDFVTINLFRVVAAEAGFQDIKTCQDSRDVLPLLRRQSVSIILLDLNMPHVTGHELLKVITKEFPEIPVIVITGDEKPETAVECMKGGAFDYLTKPVKNTRLFSVLAHALELWSLKREVDTLSSGMLTPSMEIPTAFSNIITVNSAMQNIFRYLEAIADSPRCVLISGESGTGKELIAKAVYELSGENGPFVSVNAAGLDDTVFSDTLFGHVKGAFTGADQVRKGLVEQARGGVLFLDEIGDLESSSQIKLLRLLQEKEYYPLGSDKPQVANVRVVAATNAELQDRIQNGSFRKDLYYRLMSHHIVLPPLRERPEDIPVLLDHFLDTAAQAMGKKRPSYPPELVALLKLYEYPGNIRELQSMVFDALSRHRSGMLSMQFFKAYTGRKDYDDVSLEIQENLVEMLISVLGHFPTIKEIEEALIKEALDRTEGNQSLAARMLGVSQSTLSRRQKSS